MKIKALILSLAFLLNVFCFFRISQQKATPPPANVSYARVLYDYKPERPELLVLERGTVVVIYERITADWLKGAYRKRVGLIPVNFIEVMCEI